MLWSAGVTLALHLALLIFAGAQTYGRLWTEPVVGITTLALPFLAVLAMVITPDARRDTRASSYPFRSGLALVEVTYLQCGHEIAPAPPPAPRGDGLPDVVAGEVLDSPTGTTDEQERRRDDDRQ